MKYGNFLIYHFYKVKPDKGSSLFQLVKTALFDYRSVLSVANHLSGSDFSGLRLLFGEIWREYRTFVKISYQKRECQSSIICLFWDFESNKGEFKQGWIFLWWIQCSVPIRDREYGLFSPYWGQYLNVRNSLISWTTMLKIGQNRLKVVSFPPFLIPTSGICLL